MHYFSVNLETHISLFLCQMYKEVHYRNDAQTKPMYCLVQYCA